MGLDAEEAKLKRINQGCAEVVDGLIKLSLTETLAPVIGKTKVTALRAEINTLAKEFKNAPDKTKSTILQSGLSALYQWIRGHRVGWVDDHQGSAWSQINSIVLDGGEIVVNLIKGNIRDAQDSQTGMHYRQTQIEKKNFHLSTQEKELIVLLDPKLQAIASAEAYKLQVICKPLAQELVTLSRDTNLVKQIGPHYAKEFQKKVDYIAKQSSSGSYPLSYPGIWNKKHDIDSCKLHLEDLHEWCAK